MRSREQTDDPLVNLSELSEIELLILKRMREFTIGDHRSVFHGTGYDLVALRDWQPGDRLASIDWPQSTITNFSPLVVRDFAQPSTAGVMAVADTSPSTRCGIDGVSIAAAIARAIGTIGISAVFFQDTFGLITFDAGFKHLAAVRPRIGKNQVIHCLDAYQHQRGLQDVKEADSLSTRIAGVIRKPSLIPVISDFLFDDAGTVIEELTELNSIHDVIIVLVDAAFAYDMPAVSSGWVEAFDVETGRSRVMSRRSLRALGAQAREWQDDVQQMAKAADLDVLRFGLDEVASAIALSEFVAERRLRKT
ncbi:MAG TPA: DUF58 domain-containing protein [Vicinamibacterales bacterium]